jgi:hypothetical protein
MTPLLLLLLSPLPQAPANTLSPFEREAGWELLFDGRSLAGWHRFGQPDAPRAEGGWEVVDGCLHLPAGGKGGDLATDRSFGDFELELEWRVAPGANSGVKYRVAETEGAGYMLGPEFQVLDDERHPDGKAPITSAGSLYAVMVPEGKALRPVGEFNRSRIVARGDRIEHWLNGLRVVETTIGSPAWEQRKAASKFASVEGFAIGRGVIGLQDHGDEVWFRSIRLRDLESQPGTSVEIFDGETLAGWKAYGDARYVPDQGSILGEVDGGGQSFLVSERSFGDFLLEVELKPELPGNSGIQIRSHVRENGRVYGYQVEIDSSARAWSAGLYDEARRGWLDDLSDNEAAREAFRPGEWNRYRIECLGPWIRTWVNGVPAADWIDPLDLEGYLGLQVHSGNDTRVRWRAFRMRDLGTRAWEPLEGFEVEQIEASFSVDPDVQKVRLGLPEGEGALRLRLRPRSPEAEWALYSVRVRGAGSRVHQLDPEVVGQPEAGERELCLSVAGGVLAVHLDGRLLLRTPRLPAALASGRELDLVFGAGLELTGVEALGPPR